MLRTLRPALTALAALGFVAATLPAGAQSLYASNTNPSNILKFTTSGAVSTFATGSSSSSSFTRGGLNNPRGLAFDSAGNLYAASSFTNEIVKYNSSGVGSVFASGLDQPTGIAFDGTGNLYVVNLDQTNGSFVTKISSTGIATQFATGLDAPRGVAVDKAGNVYVGEFNTSTIIKYTASGVKSVFASSGLSGPEALTFDSAGNLYAANLINNTIEKFNTSGVGTVFASSGLSSPLGLALDGAGTLYASNFGSDSIVKFNVATGAESPFADGSQGVSSAAFLAFGPNPAAAPEPSSVGALGLGLLGLSLLVLRARRRPAISATSPADA